MSAVSLIPGPEAGASVPGGRHVEATMPYAWPWDGELRAERCAVVVAGTCMTFASAAPDDPFVAAMQVCVEHAAVHGLLTLGLRHQRMSGGRQDDIAVGTSPIAVDATITCYGVDGFCGSPLDMVLRSQRRDQLLLIGFGLETAVHSTMRSANDRGYECLLVDDACVSGNGASAQVRSGAISSVCMSGGIFGAIGSTAAVVAAFASFPSPDERSMP